MVEIHRKIVSLNTLKTPDQPPPSPPSPAQHAVQPVLAVAGKRLGLV